MSTPTIPEHFPDTWNNAWIPALQLGDNRFAGAHAVESVTGDRKSFNIGGTKQFKRITDRYGKTSYVTYSTSKVWINLEDYDSPTLIDEKDQRNLDSIAVPTSRIMQDDVNAYLRLKMQTLRDTATGSRIIGETGTETESFPAGQVLAATYDGSTGTDSGLTWVKIIQATKLLDDAEVPLNDRYFVIGPAQKRDLMNLPQATDRDYAATALIRAGLIHGTEWAGFKWIEYTGLELDSTDTDARICFAYYKNDIVLGDDVYTSHMDILPERQHALQIRPVVAVGGARLRNSVVKVLCMEA